MGKMHDRRTDAGTSASGGLVYLPLLAAVVLLLVFWLPGSHVPGSRGDGGVAPPGYAAGCCSTTPALRVQSRQRTESGSFLVAARSLRDPNFAQTVVLLIDCDAEGAFGLIIDRPTRHTLAELWPEISGLESHPVYFGGPVFPSRLLFLLESEEAPQGMREVIQGVHLGSDELILKRILAEGEEEFRAYAGYSGWAPGQLDSEIARGDWHILPAEGRFVFHARPSEVWGELIQRVDIQVVKLPLKR
jgi:putative transcriptional regulator